VAAVDETLAARGAEPGRRPRGPDTFVVGDAKCGTTSLYSLLQAAPGVSTSTGRKELHWFSRPDLMERLAGPGDDLLPDSFVRTEAEYLSHFAHASREDAAVVDVSPSYLRSHAAVEAVRGFAPGARVVAVVRDPVDKVVSQYVHLWGEGRETLPFHDALEASQQRRQAGWSDLFDYLGGGTYLPSLRAWQDHFPAGQVRVEVFEELFGPDPAARHRLAEWLGTRFPDQVPHRNRGGRVGGSGWRRLAADRRLRGAVGRWVPSGLRARVGRLADRAVVLDRPEIDAADRARLRERFGPDTAALEELLGRRLPWSTGGGPR
jgi:hypothetical protein